MENVADNVNVNPAEATQTIQEMINNFIGLLPMIGTGLVVFLVFIGLAFAAKKIIRKSTNESGVGKAVARLTQLGLLISGFLLGTVIAFPSVKPGDLLSALGVGGVAIGFAFRDILQNYLAGILLLWREPFVVGDQISTSGGNEGTVRRVESRATVIHTYDGRDIVIPNSDLFTDTVKVNTAHETRRSQYDVGIGYGDDIEEAREAMIEAVSGVEGVLSDPAPEALVVELAGSTVNLRARWWTKAEQKHVIHTWDRVLTAIKKTLDERSIDMPYPTNVVLFHDQTEATDGDRDAQREGWPSPTEGDAPQPRWEAAQEAGAQPGA